MRTRAKTTQDAYVWSAGLRTCQLGVGIPATALLLLAGAFAPAMAQTGDFLWVRSGILTFPQSSPNPSYASGSANKGKIRYDVPHPNLVQVAWEASLAAPPDSLVPDSLFLAEATTVRAKGIA